VAGGEAVVNNEMTPIDRLRAIAHLVPVGSRVTCDPPPSGTDQDYLVLLNRRIGDIFHAILKDDDWEYGGSIIDDEVNLVPTADRFGSYRLDDINIIATYSPSFYQRFLAATSIAKRLNLLEKDDRIALFQAVLYGNECVVQSKEEELVF
jgi:hypothetical protein